MDENFKRDRLFLAAFILPAIVAKTVNSGIGENLEQRVGLSYKYADELLKQGGLSEKEKKKNQSRSSKKKRT